MARYEIKDFIGGTGDSMNDAIPVTDMDITELSNKAKKAYAELKKLKKGTSEYSKAFEKWGSLHRELTKAMYSGNASRKIDGDSTDDVSYLDGRRLEYKDGVFENAMKRWGFIGSIDDNYKKGTTYIDLDNNGVYDKGRLIGYFTNMTDLTQLLKHIGVIHDSTHDKEMLAELQNSVKNTYAKGLTPDPLIEQRIRELKTKLNINDIEDAYAIAASTSEVTDGNIVGGEGRSMDGIPYGLYQEGGRSYRGFEITSSENGLRKGVYRFYNWGGYGVPFGNAAVDGQFTEEQFQKLIGEGKVKLLDSVGYFGDAEISHNDVKLIKKINDEASQLQINDAGWFNLATIELQDSSELTLTKLVADVKKVVRRTVAEITNGRFDAGILRLQVLVKDNMTNKFNWMELPISYRLSYDVLRKLLAEAEYKAHKAQSEINAKLKQFAGKQIYKDNSIVSDSFILIDNATVNCNKFEIIDSEDLERKEHERDLKDSGPRYLVTAIFKKPFNQYREGDKIERTVEGETEAARIRAFLSGNYRGYVNVTLRRLRDSRKMFKVVDKATGKTLLVKATDSLAAVKRAREVMVREFTHNRVTPNYVGFDSNVTDTGDLYFPGWIKFSNRYEHHNRYGVIESIKSTGRKEDYRLPDGYLSYITTVRMDKDGRRVTSYWHLPIKESDAKKTVGMEISGRRSAYSRSIMEWYPRGSSLSFVNGCEWIKS